VVFLQICKVQLDPIRASIQQKLSPPRTQTDSVMTCIELELWRCPVTAVCATSQCLGEPTGRTIPCIREWYSKECSRPGSRTCLVVALWRCWSGAGDRVLQEETPALFIWELGNWRRLAAGQLPQLEFRDLGTVAVDDDGAGRLRAARISLDLKHYQWVLQFIYWRADSVGA
jgi:hypothetical protein